MLSNDNNGPPMEAARQLFVFLSMIQGFIISSASGSKFGPAKTGFVECAICRCYLRYGKYAIDGAWRERSLTIASIDVEESSRGLGFCRELFKELLNNPNVDTLIVECVNVQFLADALKRWGFVECSVTPDTFYKGTERRA